MTKEEIEAAEKAIADREAEQAKTDLEEHAGFSTVFTDEPSPIASVSKDVVVDETTPKDEVVPVAPVVEETPIVYANVTPEQLNDILANANSVPEVRAAVKKLQDDTAGRIGSLEQRFKDLQTSAGDGKPIKITGDDLKNFKKSFPELADEYAEDITAALAKAKLSGDAPKGETPEEFAARVTPIVQGHVDTAVQNEQKRMAPKILASRHKGWEEVLQKPESPWRTWIKTQGEAYETRMLNSWDGFELAESIDTFKEHQRVEAEKAEKAKKPTPKPVVVDTRSQRLAEAVPARGGSVVRTKSEIKTEEDAFNDAIAKIAT